jgi:2-keto-4-pentenoate hydratase
MISEPATRAASLLIRAREEGTTLPSDIVSFELASPADAYGVQALVAAKLGAVAAWKTGAPSPQAEPILAPIFADLVHVSAARLPAATFHRLGIEAEIAYRLGRDLPGRRESYTREEVVEAIAAILPAIEVVDSRLAEPEAAGAMWKLADHQSNGALVVGAQVDDWQAIDPSEQPVRLTIDGRVVAEGRGGNPAGDPLRLIAWMANHLADHCGGLRQGQIITTGSMTGLMWTRPGAKVVADFAGLGRVEVTFPT